MIGLKIVEAILLHSSRSSLWMSAGGLQVVDVFRLPELVCSAHYQFIENQYAHPSTLTSCLYKKC